MRSGHPLLFWLSLQIIFGPRRKPLDERGYLAQAGRAIDALRVLR
jgi:hypothetical protein